MGDPVKLLFLKKVLDIVQRDRLIQNAASTGEILLKELKNLEKTYSGVISASRGKGLFAALSLKRGIRQKFLDRLLNKGWISFFFNLELIFIHFYFFKN